MRAQLVGPQGASSGKALAPPHSTITAAVAGTAPAGWQVNMLAAVSVGWHQDVSVAHAALGQAAGMHGCAGCPRSRTVHWPGMPRSKASFCSANIPSSTVSRQSTRTHAQHIGTCAGSFMCGSAQISRAGYEQTMDLLCVQSSREFQLAAGLFVMAWFCKALLHGSWVRTRQPPALLAISHLYGGCRKPGASAIRAIRCGRDVGRFRYDGSALSARPCALKTRILQRCDLRGDNMQACHPVHGPTVST